MLQDEHVVVCSEVVQRRQFRLDYVHRVQVYLNGVELRVPGVLLDGSV